MDVINHKSQTNMHNSLPCIFSLQYTTLPYHSHLESYVNNVEVTVNICTCTDVFTVITKDQLGGIYNGYSTGGQGFMAVNKQTSSSGYTLGLRMFDILVGHINTIFGQPCQPFQVRSTIADQVQECRNLWSSII